MGSPSLLYRLRGYLNRLVWRMPLPRRVLARLSKLAYQNPPMPVEAVLTILDALQGAGLRSWLWGGWAVDALADTESRMHRDVDLVIDLRDLNAVMATLRSHGYTEWYRIDSDQPLQARVVLHDHELAGRAVDLHPIELDRHRLDFAMGTLRGRPVPCLGPQLQLSTRAGYRRRRQDRADIALLRRLVTRPATTLIVPVTAANDLVDESARDAGMPAHITLTYPFMAAREVDAGTEAALASLFGAVSPFRFTLARTGRFPNVVYLVPEPADPFVELARALQQRWPDYPPYGGAYGELVPHLTVAYGDAPPDGLERFLPIHATATEAWLMVRTAGSWLPRGRFALGALAKAGARRGEGYVR